MQWYNSVTKQLTTVKPGKNIPLSNPGEINYEYWLSLYPDWIKVDDNFRPPEREKTIDEKLAELDAEYEPQRMQLERDLNRAVNYWKSEEITNQIILDINNLEIEYNTKAEAIWNE